MIKINNIKIKNIKIKNIKINFKNNIKIYIYYKN